MESGEETKELATTKVQTAENIAYRHDIPVTPKERQQQTPITIEAPTHTNQTLSKLSKLTAVETIFYLQLHRII